MLIEKMSKFELNNDVRLKQIVAKQEENLNEIPGVIGRDAPVKSYSDFVYSMRDFANSMESRASVFNQRVADLHNDLY